VEFAHQDTDADETIQHGSGSIEITTDRPVETDAEKYDVARAIGEQLGKTKIVVTAIIPLEVGEVIIDYTDLITEDTKKLLENPDVYDITSLPKDTK
jgi:hypothetical protein